MDDRRPSARWPEPLPGRGAFADVEGLLSEWERRAARRIAAAGYVVTAIPRVVDRRTADRQVRGVTSAITVEVKTPRPGATSSTIRKALNESKRRGGQSRHMFIDLRRCQMAERDARRGVARSLGAYGRYFDTITVIGEAFEFTEEVRG